MAWTIEYATAARAQLDRLDRQVAQRIIDYVETAVTAPENPRVRAEMLRGRRYGGLWRYQVGDYRVICDIRDKTLVVVVVKVGHRSQVYR